VVAFGARRYPFEDDAQQWPLTDRIVTQGADCFQDQDGEVRGWLKGGAERAFSPASSYLWRLRMRQRYGQVTIVDPLAGLGMDGS
jgi:hypothetical protein